MKQDRQQRKEIVDTQATDAKPRNLEEMFATCKFSYVAPDINERNFPLIGPVANVLDMLTVSLKDLGGKNMTTDEIESAIDRKGYRPATLAEIIAYTKSWNGRDEIYALGSSWVDPRDRRFVPVLCKGVGGRELYLRWDDPEDRWFEDYLFLVVRK